ncbi:hypothetical protein CS0771_65880 [Catellatospora sp. IY07-71]|uniref:hypothetical protein n=1 Tax=Catellatospora sp. IY07-71 TaxID=2728827 RepID=UPI001BB2F911|nr:hypothetical protein [Catellatospora sp. IY07-71]BCJ77044.1 hypothetical protein CS0771_65880 [Catellatospora sp. IY07-71]
MTAPQPAEARARRITVYLPADVAAVVEAQGPRQQSAFVADAIRMHQRRAATRAMLREAGYLVTTEGVERMRQKLAALDAQRAAEQK